MPAPLAAPQVVAYRAASARSTPVRLARAYDVLMCYQIVLGRDPESRFVIDEAATQPVLVLLKAFLDSTEFADQVGARLAAGQGLPHDTWSRGPRAEHLTWLQDLFTDGAAAPAPPATWPVLLDKLQRRLQWS